MRFKTGLLVVLALLPQTVFGEDKVVDKPKLPLNMRIDSIRFADDLGLYEMVVDKNIFYLTANQKYLIAGDVVDIATLTNVTAKKREGMNKIDFGLLPLQDAVKLSDGKRAIAVFSDPDCPFCRELHEELKRLKDTAVYVFLYPLDAIHPDAKKKSVSVWCSADKVAALDAVMASGNIQEASCENPVDRNIKLAVKHKINGTPAIIFDSGKVVNGFISVERINSVLDR